MEPQRPRLFRNRPLILLVSIVLLWTTIFRKVDGHPLRRMLTGNYEKLRNVGRGFATVYRTTRDQGKEIVDNLKEMKEITGRSYDDASMHASSLFGRR